MPQEKSDFPAALVEANNRFSVKYFKHCFKPSENTLCSPTVVRQALSTFYQVSGTPVEEDFRSVLHLPEDKSASNAAQSQLLTDLTGSGALHVHTMLCTSETRTLDACFKDHLANHVPSVVVESVDLSDDVSTAYAVNSWIQSKRCEIDDLVSEGDVWSKDTLNLMMFNAVSLMTKWKLKFDAGLTESKEFKFLNKAQKVPMMHGKLKVRYCHDPQVKCKVAEVPFEQGSNYNLVIVLPDEDQNFAEMVKEVPEDLLNNLEGTLSEHWVDLQIPKFTVAMKTPVKDVLAKLNCGRVFEQKELKVYAEGKDQLDRFYQHCWLRVDESGAEANSALPESDQVTFTADRPFLYVVRKADDRSVVMLGDYSVYVDPEEQS